METLKIILRCIVCFMFFSFIPFGDGELHAAKVENHKWSFNFKNCTISDALRQMSQVTGIALFMNQNRDKQLYSKSYKSQTIDQILRDLFRQENYAMLWSYNSDGLNAIDIWIFKGSGSRTDFSMEKLSEQRPIKEEKDRLIHKTDYKPRAGNTQSDKREVDKSLFRRSKTKSHIKKEPKKSLVFQYSKPSETGSNFENLEVSVPDAGIAPEAAEEETGGANEVNPPPSSAMPEVEGSGASESNEEISQHENQPAETVPLPPAPEEIGGLEPPPMPPGFSYKK
jgi:hypothetical protein